ncbi:MAG: ATP-binding protein [Bacillota bacterium]
MIRYGLAFKIWITMFVLVAVVMGLSAILQSGLIEKIYIGQQSDRILESGRELAQELDPGGDRLTINSNVSAMSRALGAGLLLVDASGNVVAWSGGRGVGMGMGMGMGMGFGARMHGLNMPLDSADLGTVLGGQEIVRKEYSQTFGTDVIFAAIPVVKGEKTEGALLVYSPMAPIEANIKAIKEAVLYSFVFGIVAATMLALVLSRKVTGPILKINSAARAMANGDFGIKITAGGSDELGVLAESINTLSVQLSEKIKTIEENDLARREFVAGISHELRTPLTIMQGYTEALMDGIARDDREREKYLRNIYNECLRLRRLVDDVLDLRKMETGIISMQMGRVDIGEMIRDVSLKFKETMAERNIKFDTVIHGEGLLVRGDPDRLKQVLINLVDNAVRFSPAGGTVAIVGERENEKVKVTVMDQGPGIGPEDRQHIWQRFYMANKASPGRNSGSGLGLAIAKQIVDMHGGEIGVESPARGGSSFWFTVERFID